MPGQPFVKNGKTLLSGVDPVLRGEKISGAVTVKDRTLYFCPSPLYGYGLSRLVTRIQAEASGSAVLCVEADPELYELSLKNIDHALLAQKKLHLTNVPAGAGADWLVSLVRGVWGAMAFRRAETVRFTGGWQLSEALYDSLFEQLRVEIANDWSNALTLSKMGRLYIRNALINLSLLAEFKSVSDLSFGSCNALVLGAGPSLDETLDAVSCNDTRPYKIICVDTCLGSLKERGISPDLVIILESQHWNLRDFIGCNGWNVAAAVDLCSLPASAKLLGNDSYIFMTPWTPLKIFFRLKGKNLLPAEIPPLGSVGLTAVEIARRLTRGKIICAGLDFSFTQDKYHARSTPGHRGSLNRQNRFKRISNSAAFDKNSFAVVSKSGVNAYSSPVMRKYRDLFEQEFSGDSRIFDIDGTGLPLGIKTLSMKEAIDLLKCNDDEKKVISRSINDSAPLCLNVKKHEIISFFESELKRLQELRDILTGSVCADEKRLYDLLEECDYLWAHFPDYSGGRAAQTKDVSFLKRVRAELDPMINLIERAHGQIKNSVS